MSQEGSASQKSSPFVLLSLVVMAFVIGVLWQKVTYLENSGIVRGTSTGTADAANPSAGANVAQEPQGPTQGKLTEAQAKNLLPVSDSDHILGSKDAKVVLIEYSDFECPFCQRFHQTAKQVVEEYDGQVSWVYRHFPLDQIHPKARPAAIASECIAKLGGASAFWKFADAVYAEQATQSTKLTDLNKLATDAGVNSNDFTSCLDSDEIEKIVNDQYSSGVKMGITGTPGNLVVNKKGEVWLVPGALPLEQMKATIDEALKS